MAIPESPRSLSGWRLLDVDQQVQRRLSGEISASTLPGGRAWRRRASVGPLGRGFPAIKWDPRMPAGQKADGAVTLM